jgi:vacuolar-type H+-ATPase subunit B/Vma2
MDDKLKHLIEQNKGYITRKQIIGNRCLIRIGKIK